MRDVPVVQYMYQGLVVRSTGRVPVQRIVNQANAFDWTTKRLIPFSW